MLHLIFLLIGILNIDSTHSQTAPAEGSLPQTCFQGPSGIPGIPGPSGHNGLPGRDGLMGEKGEKGGPGAVGGRGLPGPRGPSGEKGTVGSQGVEGLRGLSGKVGPQGLKGSAGVDGQSGPVGAKGEKGEIGQKGETGERNGRSAFTAIKTSGQTDSGVLTFDITETNIGNNFDVSTSRFTCQIPGVYWFTFTMCRNHATDDPYVDLVKDGNRVVRAYFWASGSGGTLAQSTNGAVLHLAAGDQVWIQKTNGRHVYSNSDRYTTFSGFLLYED